ncbi:hypothetical protein [Trichothermofontia sp.]
MTQGLPQNYPNPGANQFPAPPTDLPYDDAEPLATPRHRFAMNLLIDSLDRHWQHRNDYFVGGNMFLYYSAAPVKNQVKNQDFRGPDFFAVLGVEHQRDRKYWAIWDEGGQYPDDRGWLWSQALGL